MSNHAFELIFAFDEIVALGYRESVNLAQIRTFTDMDSHEEKVWFRSFLNLAQIRCNFFIDDIEDRSIVSEICIEYRFYLSIQYCDWSIETNVRICDPRISDPLKLLQAWAITIWNFKFIV